MKTTIRDRGVLQSLRPLDLLSYLRASGWTRQTEGDERASLWAKNGDRSDAEDVLVPLRRDAADFAIRVSEVLGTLERLEQRSQEEIFSDIFSTSADLVRIRSLTPDAADGTVPLEVAVKLAEHAQDLLTAAACAAVEPRSYWSRRKPQQAVDFMRQVRMGQTERGSYVLTIFSPVPPVLRTDLDADSSPFERRVTQTLTGAIRSALDAAKKAAESGDLDPFGAAVQHGVSANLCDALTGLGHISPSRGFEVSVSWSRSRPADGAHVSSIVVDTDFIPLLREASRLFKEAESYEDFCLVGHVEKLDRPAGAAVGSVSISAAVHNRARRVLVELADPEYQEAIRAHKETKLVSCTGDLAKEGKSYRIRNPRQFQIVEVEDLIAST